MTNNQTDLDIQEATIKSLHKWRYSDESVTPLHTTLQVVMDQQIDIGWQPFPEGWTTVEWRFVQQEYYVFTASQRTGCSTY
jgi:hypothetical protein